MLKQNHLVHREQMILPAAFGRLCVETTVAEDAPNPDVQPPSGGCVLKQINHPAFNRRHQPAAFGRLCVETRPPYRYFSRQYPAAFGRLCVETEYEQSLLRHIAAQPPSGGCVLKQPDTDNQVKQMLQPPSGGCVLKPDSDYRTIDWDKTSRLRAAVC